MMEKVLAQKLVLLGVGLVVGYTAGYTITRIRANKEIDRVVDEWRDSTRILLEPEYATPEEAVKALIPEKDWDEENDEDTNDEGLLDGILKENGYRKVSIFDNVTDHASRKLADDLEKALIEDISEKAEKSTLELAREEFGDRVDTNSIPTVSYVGDNGSIVIPKKVIPKKKVAEERPLPDRDEEILAGKPYVISVDEFMNDMPEYDKITITYFEGDDTLCDEREEIIPEYDTIVTSDALTRFGQLSNDRNIVYVRNQKIGTDFEIIRDSRQWSEVIAGFTHTEKKRAPRKMKEDD